MREFDRRTAIVMLLGGLVVPLTGCGWGDDPNLVALRREYMATWMPEDVTNEVRQEMNPTKNFVGATDYAMLMRIFTSPDEAAARGGQAAALAAALADGWRVREDQQGRITMVLSTGSEASLLIGDNFPKPEWSIAMRA